MAFKYIGLNSLGDGQRRGGEEESLKFRAGTRNKVIRPVWHNKDTSHTRRMKIGLFQFKASPSPPQ